MTTASNQLQRQARLPLGRRGRRRFVALEAELLGHEPRYVPELRASIRKYLAGRSPFYEQIDHALFIAPNGRGRCAAMINRRWQRDKGDNAGFIGYFAAAPDARNETIEMLAAAEAWLADRSADRVIGPFNGAAFHGFGTLTDAFEQDPVFPFAWQPTYYPDIFDAAGYRPAYPFWSFDIDFSSERYQTTSRHALADARCTIRTLDKKRWDADLETFRSLHNETFSSEWESHTMTGPEYRELFDQFKPVLDPRHYLIAEVDGEPAGFCIGLPDWTRLFRSLHGKLGPRQMLRLLLNANRYDRAGLLEIGVREPYRRRHIGHTLAATLFRYYEQLGHSGSTYHIVNDHNHASRRLAESLGGRGRIIYTVYDKPLG